MFKIGLTSISFRNLDIDSIISGCKKAGIDGIEWGGDIHVPHGDLQIAQEVKEKTLAEGLEVSSYGSYYKVGISENEGLPFDDVLKSAIVLGAPIIRVWAGKKNYEDCSQDEIELIVKDTLRIADMAQKEGINISFEYHGGTLTNTNENVQKFADMVKHENISFYWQPPIGKSLDYCKEGLSYLLNKDSLTYVHVFHWSSNDNGYTKYLLEDGVSAWKEYLDLLRKDGHQRYLLFEFFKDGSLDSFYKDTATLKRLLEF